MAVSSRTSVPRLTADDKSRLVALLIAGLICFAIAVTSGYGAWYFFGTHDSGEASGQVQTIVTNEPQPDEANATATPAESLIPATPTPTATPSLTLAPAGELPVTASEVTLGGGETETPVRREFVKAFFIAETEVTNEQYREFVRDANHRPPSTWNEGDFDEADAQKPVTSVSWADAAAYCLWLSKRINAEVRLPTEAEWTLAARGTDNRRYAWGDEWNTEAAISLEDKGTVRSVKSFPAGRSPVGAYDMIGNVWEWTNDVARDAEGNAVQKSGVTLRIVKGGAADEERDFLTTFERGEVSENLTRPTIGFRYVVFRA